MNDSLDNEALLGRFRQWLEETRREADALPDDAEVSAEQSEARPVGLLQLVEEFTALRHEVKLQTKSSRGVAERTEQALAAMQQAMELFRSVEAKEKEAGQQAAKPLVESLMELDEALGRGRAVIDTARRRLLEDLTGHVQEQLDDLLLRLPVWRRWLCRSWCRRAQDILMQRVALDVPRHLRFPDRRIRPDSRPPATGDEKGRTVPDRVRRQAGRSEPDDGRRGR